MTGYAFRSCPVCAGSGIVQIQCGRCSGVGSVADVESAARAVLVAWSNYADGVEGAQEQLVEALGTLKGTATP